MRDLSARRKRVEIAPRAVGGGDARLDGHERLHAASLEVVVVVAVHHENRASSGLLPKGLHNGGSWRGEGIVKRFDRTPDGCASTARWMRAVSSVSLARLWIVGERTVRAHAKRRGDKAKSHRHLPRPFPQNFFCHLDCILFAYTRIGEFSKIALGKASKRAKKDKQGATSPGTHEA